MEKKKERVRDKQIIKYFHAKQMKNKLRAATGKIYELTLFVSVKNFIQKVLVNSKIIG